MNPNQYVEFLRNTLALSACYTADGAINYVCMDWRHARELLDAGASVYDELKNICVWHKTSPGQGTFYRSQHELVFVYKRGRALTSIRLNSGNTDAHVATSGPIRAPARFGRGALMS